METAQTQPAAPAPDRTRHGATRAIGFLVLGCWVVVIVASLWSGYPKSSTFADLKADVATGRVTDVQVAGGLRPGAHGLSVVELRWREGPVGYSTSVIEVTGKRVPRNVDDSDVTAVLDEPVVWLLREANPDVNVSGTDRSGFRLTLFGWTPAEWVAWAFLAALLTTLGSVVAGPEPIRATRWGWFWLVLLTTPVGSVAYLLLSGVLFANSSTTGAPTPHSRLTGGWAFLLAVVAGAGLGALG